MKLRVLSAITVGLLSVAISGHALHLNRTGTYYGSINFGVYNTASTRNMSSPITGGIGIGYNFNNYWAAQTALNFFNPTDNANSSNGHKSLYWRVEGLFNLPTHSRVSPYFAAGLGWLKVKSGHFAPDLGFGIRVFAQPNLSFGLGYRHIFQVSPSRGDNLIAGTLSYYFGNGAQTVVELQVVKPDLAAAKKFREESRYILPKGFPPCTTKGQVGCITLVGNKATMNLDVKYAIDKAVITSAYKPQLKALGDFLKKYPAITLKVNGYTSNTGTYQHNQKLSDRRAGRVKQYLVNHFDINANRLTTKGWSWTHPVSSNKTSAGRAENRRVEAVATVPLKPTIVKVQEG